MALEINGETKRIGLALSGGGFRATAFHLGVFNTLKRRGLLDKIDVISCVSGGSIAGAFLAKNWNNSNVLEELSNYLLTHSIAASSVMAGILDPFESRLDKLTAAYERQLFGKATLASLSAGPRLYLNATNLATGNMFSFVSGENKETEMGEHELGFRPAKQFKISQAVAASSAFPPVFPPLKLTHREYPVDNVDFVTLSDGGVYDNLGVNPLVRDRNNLDYLIVSDAGKPFAIDERPTEKSSIVLVNAIDILMEQVRGLQFNKLAQLANKKVAWFSIDSYPQKNTDEENDALAESMKMDALFASQIGTNLKKLSQHELDALMRHGARLSDYRMNQYMGELP